VKTLIIVAALVFAGCGKKKAEEGRDLGSGSSTMGSAAPMGSGSAMAAGSGSAMAAGSGSAMAGSAAAQVDVPIETDFEEKAKTDITDKNVDTQLGALEKDLGQ
jgi:hypothetical protein